MKFPPCKHCKHSKSKHTTVQVFQYVGWHKRRQIVDSLRCIDCYNFTWFGPTYEWEYDIDGGIADHRHAYEGDNLALLEHKSRRYDLLNKVK